MCFFINDYKSGPSRGSGNVGNSEALVNINNTWWDLPPPEPDLSTAVVAAAGPVPVLLALPWVVAHIYNRRNGPFQ